MEDDVKKIVIVSDGTGHTAKRLMDAVLAHYAGSDVQFALVDTFQRVRLKETLEGILNRVDDDYLVIYSIISEDLGDYFHRRLNEEGILHINILAPMLTTMSKFLGVHPDYQPGLLQIIDDRYYKKVDAIGYTVEHDDGRGAYIPQADIVLVGPSRTCKTPISMYLACNSGMKVANIPIVPAPEMEQYLISKLGDIDRKCVVGLTMRPETLANVRSERSIIMARTAIARAELEKYYGLDEIKTELRFCRELYKKHRWISINVTRRAIEEISREVLEELGFINPRVG